MKRKFPHQEEILPLSEKSSIKRYYPVKRNSPLYDKNFLRRRNLSIKLKHIIQSQSLN